MPSTDKFTKNDPPCLEFATKLHIKLSFSMHLGYKRIARTLSCRINLLYKNFAVQEKIQISLHFNISSRSKYKAKRNELVCCKMVYFSLVFDYGDNKLSAIK